MALGLSQNPLPLPVSGECIEGARWTITSTSQLFKLIDELECIWAAALTPQAVSRGYHYGQLLAFTNSDLLDFFTRSSYQGDFVFETQCNKVHHMVGLLKFAGLSPSFAIWSINKFPLPIAEGEFYDGREAIVMDFSVDLRSLCAGEGDERTARSNWSRNSMRPFQTGIWPMRLFIDLLRVVGCDTDGGTLLLGRTFMLDPEKSLNRPAFTVLFFVLKTFDPKVTPPEFNCGDAVTLDKTFSYYRHGALDFLSRLGPLRYKSAVLRDDLQNGLFDYNN